MTDTIEIARAAIAALNLGDFDGVLEYAAPDFTYDLSRTVSPLQGVHSLSGTRRVLEEFLGSWEAYRYEPHDFIAAGEHVVVPFTTHFRARDGLELTTDATWVWTFRDGAAIRMTLYQDHDEALAAAGLEGS